MQYGQFYMTRGILDNMERSRAFCENIVLALIRYICGDWGELCEDDRKLNDEAITDGGRIFAAYPSCMGKIWIITEWDRSATTILFPDEY